MRAWVTDEESRTFDGRSVLIATFSGTAAESRAVGFIETLPGHESGRYGLDVDRGEADPADRIAGYLDEAEEALRQARDIARLYASTAASRSKIEAALRALAPAPPRTEGGPTP